MCCFLICPSIPFIIQYRKRKKEKGIKITKIVVRIWKMQTSKYELLSIWHAVWVVNVNAIWKLCIFIIIITHWTINNWYAHSKVNEESDFANLCCEFLEKLWTQRNLLLKSFQFRADCVDFFFLLLCWVFSSSIHQTNKNAILSFICIEFDFGILPFFFSSNMHTWSKCDTMSFFFSYGIHSWRWHIHSRIQCRYFAQCIETNRIKKKILNFVSSLHLCLKNQFIFLLCFSPKI